MIGLGLRTAIALALTRIAMAICIFLPAWTLSYWQGWVFLAVYFGTAVPGTAWLAKRDPALLERRLKGGPTFEKQRAQKAIMWLASAGFVGLLVVSGLDHRFGWSSVPVWAVIVGDALIVIGMYLTFMVFRENTFTSATIEIAADQRVISTGPYRFVRHPMYASAFVYLVGMCFALASYWSFVVLLVMIPVFIWRLLDEEKFLGKNLVGYLEYRKRVRWRLLPGVF